MNINTGQKMWLLFGTAYLLLMVAILSSMGFHLLKPVNFAIVVAYLVAGAVVGPVVHAGLKKTYCE